MLYVRLVISNERLVCLQTAAINKQLQYVLKMKCCGELPHILTFKKILKYVFQSNLCVVYVLFNYATILHQKGTKVRQPYIP